MFLPDFEFQLLCPRCQYPIVLPHQSPLGKFQGLDCQPTGDWPVTFLCRGCGRLSEYFGKDVLSVGIPVLVQNQRLPDLWQIDCECDRENCGGQRAIYTTYPAGAPEEDVERLVLQCVTEVPCSDDHSLLLSGEKIALTRFAQR